MVIRHGSAGALVVALWALVLLASCAQLPAPRLRPTKVSTGPVSTVEPAAIAVHATDANGGNAGNVLVLLYALHARPKPDATPAVLVIVDRHFEPAVLPVHVGDSVQIDNLDSMPHDVYSFSEARPLSLRLAAGERGKKLRFPRAGVVRVGCKIYNDMQGYIYVTDAAYFGRTDSNGFLRLSGLAPGSYRVNVLRPDRPDADPKGFPRTIKLEPGAEDPVLVRFWIAPTAAEADARMTRHNK